MTRLSTGILGMAWLALLACNDSSRANDCGDVAWAGNACLYTLGMVSDPTIEASCQAATCTGSRQKAIDCIVGLECTADYRANALACMAGEECTAPKNCEDVADFGHGCLGTPWSATLSACLSWTCTGSKQEAIDCVTALTCDGNAETNWNTCLSDRGCVVPG